MPKGSKKRRADKRRKELEAKTKANDAAEPPPAPNSQENSTGVATAAAANLAVLADNMIEGVVQNKNVLARNVLGSKENEASKELTLVNEIACNLPCLSNSENEASKENEGEKVLVDDDIIVQYSSKGKTEVDLSEVNQLDDLVVTDSVMAEEMTQIEDQFEEAVIAEEIAEEMTQALMAADSADQFEEAVISEEMTQVLLNKKVDQSANLVARDILKKTISFLSAEQILNQNEGNLLASFEVEKKYSNEDMVAMGTDEQVPILDVSSGETNTEMVETYNYKESPGIGLQLNRIKEMAETGLSIADNMKELFLIIMDDLNAILDA